ncbi:VOC family protein [Paenibacillus sp. 598K]|uniref:VOC family protein n=1 Tax=Paenibacillus sp. 598K TaxID=1117987 RepID=UPI0016256A6A|nr:VOC family protein [Paenibacillus sp. 598K]
MNHVCYIVQNIDEAIKYYIAHFNYSLEFVTYNRSDDELKIAWRNPNLLVHLAMLKGTNLRIELIEHVDFHKISAELTHAPYPHICYKVDDLSSAYQELVLKGIEFLSPPQIVRNKVKIVFFTDANNVVHELLEVL